MSVDGERIQVVLDYKLKRKFKILCVKQNVKMSTVITQFIKGAVAAGTYEHAFFSKDKSYAKN